MRQHQNTNNKLVDNKKGGVDITNIAWVFCALCNQEGEGEIRETDYERERENQSSFVSCVLSEVRRTKRE